MIAASRQPRAFTLIELLVVIAITTMLIGILFPSLRKARESARDTQCRNRLRSVYIANTLYIHDYGKFPDMNNDPDDGTWQYNYLIYDGRDFEQNFGPLIDGSSSLDDVRMLYCPVQKDPYHSLATRQSPWPVRPAFDTRSSFSRRYHLSGKSMAQITRTRAFVADALHLPGLIKSGHKTGVNVAYTDGHTRWVSDPGMLTKNELAHPFDVMSNPTMRKIWKMLDQPGTQKTKTAGGTIGG